MRGTDPTKSKWECPNMLYVCFWLRPLYRDKRKLTECITEQIIRNSGYFFVCNIRQHYAIFYHIYVQMYKLDSNMSKYWRVLYLNAYNSVDLQGINEKTNLSQVGF